MTTANFALVWAATRCCRHPPAERQEREQTSFLAYRDHAGSVADFHALRHTFISNLARSGVHPKQAQTLARHSDINLTLNRYTHTTQGEQSEALERLPDLSSPVGRQAKATGTDGKPANKDLARSLAPEERQQCNPVQPSAVKQPVEDDQADRHNPRDNSEKAPKDKVDEEVRLRGFEPPTYGLGIRRSIP